MPRLDILRAVDIERTPRLLQMEGMFDVPPSQRSEERWTVDLDLPDDWNVGVIVGPSGAGKTTIARELFGDAMPSAWDWPEDRCVLDGFPAAMPIKEIVGLLSSVGFSSPPSWVRPFRVLSNGEQFRVNLARTLAESPDLAVVDEFTSVVDRTVAQIGSAAVAKTVRRRNQRFVAVSCHYDILDWLEPDWVYEPHTGTLERGRLRQRPPITLDVVRVDKKAWQLFRKHHYLNTEIQSNAQCFLATWRDAPVAFAAASVFPHPTAKDIMREHRLVCLPDYQGVGIGNALSEWTGSLYRGLGKRYRSLSTHPSVNNVRACSLNWRQCDVAQIGTPMSSRSGKLTGQRWRNRTINTRLMQTYEYIGPAMDATLASALHETAAD